MRHTQKHSIKAIMLSIDFKSCFDLIHQESIFQTLEYFKFGNYFVNMIRLLFTDFHLIMQHNGRFSSPFLQGSGTHQGDPSASLLYLCVGELVNRLIKSITTIKGIKMNDVEVLLSQFADDTDLFLEYNEVVLNEVLITLDKVESSLGLKVNYNKTTVYRMGSIANTNAKLYTIRPLAWTNKPVNVLGVVVSNDMNVQDLNYQGIINRIDSILALWTRRNLTLSGKIVLINSLIASLFVYKMQVLPIISDTFVNQYKALVTQFLWNGKRPKIPYNVLIKNRESGGLRLADLTLRDLSLKVQWVRIIQQNEFFANVASAALGGFDVLIWFANLGEQDILQMFQPSFWRDVLVAGPDITS